MSTRALIRCLGAGPALLPLVLALVAPSTGCAADDAASSVPKYHLYLSLKSVTRGRVGLPVSVSASSDGPVQAFRWKVTDIDGKDVPVRADGNGSLATFTPEIAGTHTIACEADLSGGYETLHAEATLPVDSSDAQRAYEVQVITPDTIGAPTTRHRIVVGDGDRVGVAVQVDDGVDVSVVVRDALGQPRAAFVSLWGQLGGPLLVDRYLTDGTGKLRLSGRFDALVVPRGDGLAPKRLTGLDAAQLTTGWTVNLDAGVAVRGAVFDDRAPLDGAVVTVRSDSGLGAVPSTVGTTDAIGRYALRARTGSATLTVVPPASSGRAIARVDNIKLDGSTSGWQFAYAALPRVRLDARVTRSDGATPAGGVRVVVEAANLPDVGELSTPDGATYKAVGRIKRELVSNAAGELVEPGSASSGAPASLLLPPGSYTIALTPSSETPSAEGPRSVLVELSAGQAKVTTLSLAQRAVLSGTVKSALGAADGSPHGVRATVKATDSHGRTLGTVTDAVGNYTLDVDDGETYSVFVRPLVDVQPGPPPQGTSQQQPRGTIIGPAHIAQVAVNGSRSLDIELPRGVRVEGYVETSGSLRVGNAIVRVVCIDQINCTPGLVIDETRTDADGAFKLRVPLPDAGAAKP